MSGFYLRFSFFISLIAFIIILVFTTTAYSQDESGISFRSQLPIKVKNNSSTPVNNTQVMLRINTQTLIALGLMQSNGNDIRFSNACSPFPGPLYNYWIEGYMNTDSTKIWVKIPAIPANDSILIYMYFGNSGLGAGSTLSTFNGPNSSTDSVANGGAGSGVANNQRGFRFTANSNILITHFGKREPLGTTRYVTLFDFTSQAILRQKQVSGPAAQYTYDTLGSPIWLNSGQQYLLELFGDASSFGYYFGASSQIGQHLTYVDMKYCNACTQNTFPTSTLTNIHYGYPDFWYYAIDNPVTPVPTNINGQPADTNTPAAPTNLNGIPGNQMVALRWSKNTEFDAAKYLIYRNTTNNPGTAALIDSTVHPDTMYTNTGLTNGTTYYYWVRCKDRFCSARTSAFSTVLSIIPTGIQSNNNEIPKVYALHQNFPNPFNPVTNISFDIPRVSFTRLTIYDVLGKEIAVIVNDILPAGRYKVDWNSEKFASGIYFFRIEAGSFIDRKKMVVLK